MGETKSVQINLRVSEQVAMDLDSLAKQDHLSRLDVARQILLDGVAERKRSLALELYRQGRVSKSRAAELAGISLWEFLELVDREAPSDSYTLEEALEEMRRIVASGR